MFLSINKLPNEIPLSGRPDPKAAQALQEGLGGQFGEGEQWCNIYFRIWTLEDAKLYKDLLRSVATEEIGHAELVANTIKILLEGERNVSLICYSIIIIRRSLLFFITFPSSCSSFWYSFIKPFSSKIDRYSCNWR